MVWDESVQEATAFMNCCDDGKSGHSCIPLYRQILQQTFGGTPFLVYLSYAPPGQKRDRIPLSIHWYYVHIVLFVEAFSGKHLDDADERERADARMRKRFQQLTTERPVSPKLYGLCAFGQNVALYVCDRESGLIEPSHPKRGKPPIRWWNINIVEEDGQQEFFNKVVEPLKCIVDDLEEATKDLPPFLPEWKWSV